VGEQKNFQKIPQIAVNAVPQSIMATYGPIDRIGISGDPNKGTSSHAPGILW
jgi:hypothetical protein